MVAEGEESAAPETVGGGQRFSAYCTDTVTCMD